MANRGSDLIQVQFDLIQVVLRLDSTNPIFHQWIIDSDESEIHIDRPVISDLKNSITDLIQIFIQSNLSQVPTNLKIFIPILTPKTIPHPASWESQQNHNFIPPRKKTVDSHAC